MKANYSVITETKDYILLQDEGPWDKFQTITNAAEEVVAELAPTLAGRRLFYADSEGQVDELLVKDGAFAGFKPGGGPVDV